MPSFALLSDTRRAALPLLPLSPIRHRRVGLLVFTAASLLFGGGQTTIGARAFNFVDLEAFQPGVL
jgi:hypothetical protein